MIRSRRRMGGTLCAAAIWTAFDSPTHAFAENSPAPSLAPVSQSSDYVFSVVLAVVLILGTLLLPKFLGFNRRRRELATDSSNSPLQFEPPDHLRAAEMAAAWKGTDPSMLQRAFAATLIDLAARGHIVIADFEDLTVQQVPDATGILNDWESRLVNQIFNAGSVASVSKKDEHLARLWYSEFSGLLREAMASGRRNANRGAIFQRETKESARFLALTLGFRRLFATDASAARLELTQRLGLPAAAVLATMLPYAMVFSVGSNWIKAFPDLSAEELRASGLNVQSVAALRAWAGSSSNEEAGSKADTDVDWLFLVSPRLSGLSRWGGVKRGYDGRGGGGGTSSGGDRF